MSVETTPRTGLHRFTFYLVHLACIALLLALCTVWVSQWGYRSPSFAGW